MLTKNLFVVAMLAALGLSVSTAQARDFDHRGGFQGSHRTAQHDNFRHGHHVSHHRHHSHRHFRHHGR